ncbi:hypothetical protein Dvina_50920 [Dactylosporangium vinaceum]|uniref:DUF6114 domain-containing protein n=1 Tax=Dactylosporangium vinaceum TaxID=53362 RepID=A0ABV5M4I6_9ACTN|nr:DUF6114 domain-containing protein [Dactylosporangium vinaceum]UAB96171.1 hypothetical protein Dvina_50920 [Dactylosporangium vinaceum]
MTFGGWRAQRPFWGGLFLILSGLELFLSGNLKLALEVHFGPTGFLSYVLPLIMLLCGALTWVSPSQRLFYGILGTVTALYSLIGLNLGGFFLGTVLGLVGGGLAVAWSPPPAEAEPAVAEPPAAAEDTYYEDAPLDDMMTSSYWSSTTADASPAADYDRPPSGVLRDEIPTNQVSPLHAHHEGTGAGSADEQLPPLSGPGDLPKRRHLGPLLMALFLALSVFATLSNRGGEAYAAPATCPSSSSARPASPASPPATKTQPAPPPASPPPSPTPTATAEEKPGILDWLHDLFTGGDKKATTAAAPSSSSTPPPPAATTAAPATTKAPASGKPSSTPACGLTSASPTPNDKKAKLAAGQPHVANQPSILRADVMTMDSLTYDGVADLPRKDGTTVKVLAFSMKNSISTPFQLDTPGGPKLLITRSSKLTVEGDVKFYTSKFSANVLGLIPLTFTPSFPPPPIPLPGFYTKCEIELVYVQSNVLTAPDLDIQYAR